MTVSANAVGSCSTGGTAVACLVSASSVMLLALSSRNCSDDTLGSTITRDDQGQILYITSTTTTTIATTATAITTTTNNNNNTTTNTTTTTTTTT